MYYIYILTNQHNTVLYTGVTNNLVRRLYEHKNGINKGFTYKYNVHKLVYYEVTDNAEDAILREKAVKKLSRKNKVILIEKFNPNWNDLPDSV